MLDAARRGREERLLEQRVPEPAKTEAGDDTLFLLFCCCHPDLSPASQVALTLRAVGGLTTREIADAFYVPEATMAQRISRAKRQSGRVPTKQKSWLMIEPKGSSSSLRRPATWTIECCSRGL